MILLPCPFCGGVAENGKTAVWWVTCGDCGADGPTHDTEAEAAEAWNAAPRATKASSFTPTPDDLNVLGKAIGTSLGKSFVDALFGIGLKPTLRGHIAALGKAIRGES